MVGDNPTVKQGTVPLTADQINTILLEMAQINDDIANERLKIENLSKLITAGETKLIKFRSDLSKRQEILINNECLTKGHLYFSGHQPCNAIRWCLYCHKALDYDDNTNRYTDNSCLPTTD